MPGGGMAHVGAADGGRGGKRGVLHAVRVLNELGWQMNGPGRPWGGPACVVQ